MSKSTRYSYPIDLDSDSTAAKVVRLVGKGKKVLELGCAAGHMSQILQDRGCQVIGIEIDGDAAQSATPYCERVIVGDLDDLDVSRELGARRFDVVVAADVLEHLKAPSALLARLRDLLEPEGCVVVSIPNVAHGSVRLSLLAGSFSYREKGLLDQTHLRFFTRETLEDMFEEAGFAITHLDRNRMEIEQSEVSFPQPVSETVMHSLLKDPEACTYQFIVVAHPFPRAAVKGLRTLFREAEREVRKIRLQTEKHRQSAEEIPRLRRRLRVLTSDRRDMAEKVASLERMILENRKFAEEIARLKTQQARSGATIDDIQNAQKEHSKQLLSISDRIEAVSESQREIGGYLFEMYRRLQKGIEGIGAAAQGRTGDGIPAPDGNPAGGESGPIEPQDVATRIQEYRRMVGRIRDVVRERLPLNSTFLVVSRGDDELLRVEGCTGEHFPQREDGVYAGFYPATSQEAISHLEETRGRKGAHYLIFPAVARWWLEHYRDFKDYLESSYRKFFDEPGACLIFELNQPALEGQAKSVPDAEETHAAFGVSPAQLLVQALLPSNSTLVVVATEKRLLMNWGQRRIFSYEPTEGTDAIQRLERLREAGGHFLVVPEGALLWLQGQPDLIRHLEGRYRRLVHREQVCSIYSLEGA